MEQVKIVGKEANHLGAMLSVQIPLDLAKKLAIEGGEAPEELHITLFYFGDAAELTSEQMQMILYGALGVTSDFESFDVRLNGTKIFEENAERPLYAVVECPRLEELRARLAKVFDRLEVSYSKDYEYKPHVTLKYLNAETAPEVEVDESFSVDAVEAVFADEHIPIVAEHNGGNGAGNFPAECLSIIRPDDVVGNAILLVGLLKYPQIISPRIDDNHLLGDSRLFPERLVGCQVQVLRMNQDNRRRGNGVHNGLSLFVPGHCQLKAATVESLCDSVNPGGKGVGSGAIDDDDSWR